ncbi:MAG: 4-hydroxythreonine-4-phosphate dehydrogenase PdxA [Candidatus Cloacimonetes bacterium]|nr:4-hydroxythreonine-4-phosphate dehydrogenase PdxA [Candidatus Cloacimonadota bacterium]
MAIIGITLGDPGGIGPEIVLKVLKKHSFDHTLILYGTFPTNMSIPEFPVIHEAKGIRDIGKDVYWILSKQDSDLISGNPSQESGIAAYDAIKQAGEDALNGYIDAVVTAPIGKHYIQLSHPDFIGHTEFFAHQAHDAHVVMSFFSDKLNVALLTTHCAVSEVSSYITIDDVVAKMHIINSALKSFFHISHPKLALLGLNPHAGEYGAFGNEELVILKPAVDTLRTQGVEIDGPYPADTFFAGNYQKYDMIISLYHDQGLIPFKMLSFDTGVNVTLGLPYIRTSVDHGTAFDIAGKGIASEKSFLEAIILAIKMLS